MSLSKKATVLDGGFRILFAVLLFSVLFDDPRSVQHAIYAAIANVDEPKTDREKRSRSATVLQAQERQ